MAWTELLQMQIGDVGVALEAKTFRSGTALSSTDAASPMKRADQRRITAEGEVRESEAFRPRGFPS